MIYTRYTDTDILNKKILYLVNNDLLFSEGCGLFVYYWVFCLFVVVFCLFFQKAVLQCQQNQECHFNI